MKIGLFLGSFDPPHLGHLDFILSGLKEVDEVIVIPAYSNPFKPDQLLYSARLDLTNLAISELGCPRVKVSEVERVMKNLRLDTRTYNVLEFLRNTLSGELVLLTTEETKEEIPTWYRGSEILKMEGLEICTLPKSSRFPDLSSTQIRKAVKKGLAFEEFLTPKVFYAINKNKIYKK